jgi:hypothetical protein
MNSSQLSNEDSDIKLLKVFNKLKNDHHSKISHKELKKVKQEKESLIIQLSESHALIDSLRFENTMLFNIIDSLEIKLKNSVFSSDNLKSMIGHIRPNCCLLKSHRPWIKQDAMRKCKVEDFSSSKYVPPHRRHIEGKGIVMCKNANHNFAENVKKHSNKRSLPICHHYGIIGHIQPKCPQL